MATSPQTVAVKVELDAEAFQDAVQHAIDAAANAAHPFPLEHVRPEEVREGDVLLVPVRVVSVRPPTVGDHSDPARSHIRTIPVAGPWSVDRSGRIWTHAWTVDGAVLIRKVQP